MAIYAQTPTRLAEKLFRIRANLGLSQNQLIRELGFEGELKQSHISSYESQKYNRIPPVGVILRYARLANLPMEVLVDDDLDLPKRFQESNAE
jgi:transcriptional regulator with XRE-family HTH domain